MNKRLPALVLLLLSPLALAHPGHGESGLIAGFMHPITGIDHLLTMLAVGLWAVQRQDKQWWLLPAAFVGLMLPGAAMGLLGIAPPAWLESAIAGALLLIGLLLGLALKPGTLGSCALVGAIAMLHGWAHGAELPAGLSASAYMGGFALATALLHLGGVGVSIVAIHHWQAPRLIRALGAVCGGVGSYLLLG